MTTGSWSVSENVPSNTDVGRAARQGGAWAVISYGFTKATGFASSIVLARLLMPEHFGLIGMVNTVTAMVQTLGASGISAAVIHQRKDVEAHANTAWWIDLFVGIGLFIIANLSAPIAAVYYHEPRIRLILAVVSLNFLINPFGNMMDVLLRRGLQFKLSTKINLTCGFVASVLTIVLAFLGAGVWSFVYPHLVAGIVGVILKWHFSSFRPSRQVDWTLARGLWRFGRNMFGSGIFHYINQNADYLIVGRLLGGRELGLYVFAYNLGTWIVSNVSWTISDVLFPTIASVQHDRERAKAMFLKLIRLISLVGFPIACIQWAIAPVFVGAIYGTKWLPAVNAFRLIALYGMGRAVCGPALTLVSALGRPDINLKMTALTSPMLVVGLYIGAHYGITGVAFATALVHGLFVWFYMIVPFRVLGWNTVDSIKAITPALICSIMAGCLTAIVYRALGDAVTSLSLLAVLLLVGFGSYVLFVRVFFGTVALETASTLRKTIRDARA